MQTCKIQKHLNRIADMNAVSVLVLTLFIPVGRFVLMDFMCPWFDRSNL